MAVGTGVSTRSRGRSAKSGEDGEEDGQSTVKFEDFTRGRSADGGRSNGGHSEPIVASRAIRQALKDLDNGFGEKMSLLKMLIMRFDENNQNYNRLRKCIISGEMETADK